MKIRTLMWDYLFSLFMATTMIQLVWYEVSYLYPHSMLVPIVVIL